MDGIQYQCTGIRLKKKTMRHFTRYSILIALAVIAAGALAGCSIDERRFSPEPEGAPIDFTLHYSVNGSTVYTKAAQDSISENQVNNLLILIFDSNGNRVRRDDGTAVSYYFINDGNGITDYHPYGGALDPTTGTVKLEDVPSTNGATIIGIANLTTDYTTTSFTIRRETLENVLTLEELGNVVMPMREESVERSALFMMTGQAVSGENDRININNSNLDNNGNLACTLELERVDAKVRVIVTAQNPENDPSISNMTFEPKTWRVMNVPRQSLLLKYDDSHKDNIGGKQGPWDDDGHWDASAEEFGYDGAGWFDTDERNYEKSMLETSDNSTHSYGGSFVFYMPESRRRYKLSIREAMPDADADARYAMREESNTEPFDGEENGKPGQIYSNVDFKYADDKAPYLILTGYLSYDRALADGTTRVVSADVRYIVHLGSDVANADDYDTRRNGYYTYTITIQGVNSMLVEVTGGEEGEPYERRPGYEGDLSYSINEVFMLDSHYDRSLLQLNANSISDLMTWSVRTQFTPGFVYDPTVEGTEYAQNISEVDYRWVKFVIHGLRNKQGISPSLTDNVYAPYPGEASLKYNPNGYQPDWNPDDWEYSKGYDAVPQALNVDQLIKFLKKVKIAGHLDDLVLNNDLITITAFVDENVTVYRPGSKTAEQTLWKEMVDVDSRQLHILTPEDDRIFSPDGNTSMVQSSYTFVQRAIRTLYDKDSDVTTAWGLESTMEAVHPDQTDSLRLEPGNVSAGTSTSNGRWNTWEILKSAAPGRKWSDIINKSKRYGLNSGYDQAIYACLLRNRDLDGDDEIDAFELRWYLAAIDQLTDIYIGEWALDEASRLYPQEASLRPGGYQQYWHYTSSSYDKNENGPWVLWAEEGASRGSYNQSKVEVGEDRRNGPKYAYRCVRNLGFMIEDEKEAPANIVVDDFVKVSPSPDANGDYTIDLSRMNPNARRSVSDGGIPLPAHNETEANNRTYKAFKADDEAVGLSGYGEKITENHWWNGLTWINMGRWDEFADLNDNPCPPGYRMPNQRELLIMSTRLEADQWPLYHEGDGSDYPSVYISQTAFSLNGSYDYEHRGGFIWNYNSKVFMLQNWSDPGEIWGIPVDYGYKPEDSGYVRCIKDTDETVN